MKQGIVDKYIKRPTVFCPGCGDGILMNCFIHACDELGLNFKKMVFVSGIGCAAWISDHHFKAHTFHTTHGRALAYATGIKLANPKLEVVVISGDGDLATIGGNHLIHTARRNIPITVICANNYLYGMTGGQVGATTPLKARTSTTPEGNLEPPFDLVKLVSAAGAGFTYRESLYPNPQKLVKRFKEALEFKGFSFVEILTTCPTYFGKMNSLSPVDMLKEQGK